MNNARRRKEILVFALILASSTDLVEKEEYRSTYQGIFRFLHPLDQALIAALPTERERHAELRKVQKVVNGIVPKNWSSAPDAWRFWFAVQLGMRMVASGWPLPRNELEVSFVQALYHVGQAFNLSSPPTAVWLKHVQEAPEKLRAMGMYK